MPDENTILEIGWRDRRIDAVPESRKASNRRKYDHR